ATQRIGARAWAPTSTKSAKPWASIAWTTVSWALCRSARLSVRPRRLSAPTIASSLRSGGAPDSYFARLPGGLLPTFDRHRSRSLAGSALAFTLIGVSGNEAAEDGCSNYRRRHRRPVGLPRREISGAGRRADRGRATWNHLRPGRLHAIEAAHCCRRGGAYGRR